MCRPSCCVIFFFSLAWTFVVFRSTKRAKARKRTCEKELSLVFFQRRRERWEQERKIEKKTLPRIFLRTRKNHDFLLYPFRILCRWWSIERFRMMKVVSQVDHQTFLVLLFFYFLLFIFCPPHLCVPKVLWISEENNILVHLSRGT